MHRTIPVILLLAGCQSAPTLPPAVDLCENYQSSVIPRDAGAVLVKSPDGKFHLQAHGANEVFFHDKCNRRSP